ncbi:MAG: FmdB family transcriptional regulator [Ruaniaceae bacterium]|nr:FmdB family transcriptional regulator [Ruaniaceae bacterium]
MPTYAYRCTQCGEAFDIYQRFDEDSLTECPACSGRLRKLFTPTGIVFKGGGFYRTDSRGTGSKSSIAPSAGSSTASSKGPTTRSPKSD